MFPEPSSRNDGSSISGLIRDVNFPGSAIRVPMAVAGDPISRDTFNRPDASPPAVGTKVQISVAARDLLVLAE